MKVGTDGVLLGAWFPMERGKNVLDVGCGTGLVAIMAAQRGAASVTAVEIDPQASQQAFQNAANSEWNDRIFVQCADFAHFTAEFLQFHKTGGSELTAACHLMVIILDGYAYLYNIGV